MSYYEIGGWLALALFFIALFGNIMGVIPTGYATLMILPAFIYHARDRWRNR